LSLLDFSPGFQQREKANFVDFRKGPHCARSDRPFHLKRVAFVFVVSRQIPDASPRMHNLPALLLNAPQLDKRTDWPIAHLFEKFPLRRLQQILALVRLAFRNGPVPVVFSRK